MADITEFIVESIDISDETLKFFKNIQDLNSKEIQTLNGNIVKKFTSLATNATIFRWKFGDNPIIETTVNPYIYTFHHSGTYSVRHQSCYPCVATGTLICSNGWCTKSIEVRAVEEHGKDSIVVLAGFAGLLFIAKEDNCCKLRDRCTEQRTICTNIKPEDIENIKRCKSIEKICITRLEKCKNKCTKSGHKWEPLPYKCLGKQKPHKEICQTIEKQKYIDKKKKDKGK